jgi:membrane associated rhomboid family serine protease
MFPSAQRVMIVPIIFVPILIKMPAIGFAFFWMMSQIISGIMTLMMLTDGGGIAGWAHMGGFIAVWILAPLVKRPACSYRRYYGDEGFYRFFPRDSRMKGGSQWIY